MASRKTPKLLQGFTPEQRFFVAFAQARCEEARPEERRLRLRTGGPAPAKSRVNGAVTHMKEFAEAFSCPKEAAMVRRAAETCEVW